MTIPKSLLVTILGWVLAGLAPAGIVLLTMGIWVGNLETDVGYHADTIIQMAGNVDELEDRVHDNSSHDEVIDTKLDHINSTIIDLKREQEKTQRQQRDDTEKVLRALEKLEDRDNNQ